MRPSTTDVPGIEYGGAEFVLSMNSFDFSRISRRTWSKISWPLRQVSIRNAMMSEMANGNQPPSKSFVEVDVTNSKSRASRLPFTAYTREGLCFHCSATN